MKLNQKGFTLVEGLLIAAVVGIVGFGGYYVWNENQSEDPESTEVSQKESSAKDGEDPSVNDKDEIEEKNNLNTYSDSTYNFSFEYPDEEYWKVGETSGIGELVGVTANITNIGRNSGFAFTMFVFDKGSESAIDVNYIKNDQMEGNDYYSLKTEENIDVGGFPSIRLEYTPADDMAGNLVFYVIEGDEYSYWIQVNQNGALSDNVDITEEGEKIVRSLKLS